MGRPRAACAWSGLGEHEFYNRAFSRTFFFSERPIVRFFLDPITWILILAVLVSGGLLFWPLVSRSRAGGISTSEAVRLINREKAVVIDVREPGEFAAGRVEGSRNVPLGRLEVAPELPKNKSLPVILVCATGKRAARAAKALEAKGYAKALVLAGGVEAWRAANLPMSSDKTAA
jgi:rhodanese-related sulfurtransferase